jgi:hypothetical protein
MNEMRSKHFPAKDKPKYMSDTPQDAGMNPPPDESMGSTLDRIIEQLPTSGVTLKKILALIGEGGLLMLAGLLALVFLIPVSIPGVSTVFGAAILLIGISRLFHRGLWLPESIASRVIAADQLRAAMLRAARCLHRLEGISKPQRLGWLAARGPLEVFNNLMLILAAILLMAPFGFIPFSNTLPALAVICLVLGLLQRDGVCLLLGYIANLTTMIYFVALLAGGAVVIRQALRHFGL